MPEVEARSRIALPREACWQKLRDLERAIDYVPGLSAVRLTSAQREGVGASRVVVHERTGAMDETVEAWREGEGFTLRLHRGERGPAPPLDSATFEYALVPLDDGACEIVTRMRYRLRWGLLGAALDGLGLRALLARSVRDVALALAEHYRTDERVTPERLRELRRDAG